jgi:hypothetical protein
MPVAAHTRRCQQHASIMSAAHLQAAWSWVRWGGYAQQQTACMRWESGVSGLRQLRAVDSCTPAMLCSYSGARQASAASQHRMCSAPVPGTPARMVCNARASSVPQDSPPRPCMHHQALSLLGGCSLPATQRDEHSSLLHDVLHSMRPQAARMCLAAQPTSYAGDATEEHSTVTCSLPQSGV